MLNNHRGGRKMTTIMEKFWWAFILRGILAIACGVGMHFCQSVSSLGYLFGIFALSQGVLSGLPVFSAGSRGTYLAGIEGVMGVLVAFFILIGSSTGALLWPSVSNVIFLIYIVSWIVVTGVVALVMFIQLLGKSAGGLYVGLNAALCLIFGVLLAFRHAQGALGNVGILGIFCMLYGVVLVLTGRKAHGEKP
jgi:uncharacterized membrane protein HdeD (DUF308 family)